MAYKQVAIGCWSGYQGRSLCFCFFSCYEVWHTHVCVRACVCMCVYMCVCVCVCVKRGQEITIAYIRLKHTSTRERQKQLRKSYNFYCMCKHCQRNKTLWNLLLICWRDMISAVPTILRYILHAHAHARTNKHTHKHTVVPYLFDSNKTTPRNNHNHNNILKSCFKSAQVAVGLELK